jgi:hypothetical protein
MHFIHNLTVKRLGPLPDDAKIVLVQGGTFVEFSECELEVEREGEQIVGLTFSSACAGALYHLPIFAKSSLLILTIAFFFALSFLPTSTLSRTYSRILDRQPQPSFRDTPELESLEQRYPSETGGSVGLAAEAELPRSRSVRWVDRIVGGHFTPTYL